MPVHMVKRDLDDAEIEELREFLAEWRAHKAERWAHQAKTETVERHASELAAMEERQAEDLAGESGKKAKGEMRREQAAETAELAASHAAELDAGVPTG
jgi:hypothetical protein